MIRERDVRQVRVAEDGAVAFPCDAHLHGDGRSIIGPGRGDQSPVRRYLPAESRVYIVVVLVQHSGGIDPPFESQRPGIRFPRAVEVIGDRGDVPRCIEGPGRMEPARVSAAQDSDDVPRSRDVRLGKYLRCNQEVSLEDVGGIACGVRHLDLVREHIRIGRIERCRSEESARGDAGQAREGSRECADQVAGMIECRQLQCREVAPAVGEGETPADRNDAATFAHGGGRRGKLDVRDRRRMAAAAASPASHDQDRDDHAGQSSHGTLLTVREYGPDSTASGASIPCRSNRIREMLLSIRNRK